MKIGGIATIPARKGHLKAVLKSISYQLDQLYVVLNGYKEIPDFIKGSTITPILSNNDKGDAMKFIMAHEKGVTYYTFDDDLVYPPDYCEYMLAGLAKYGGIVTLHGRNYPRPLESFKKWSDNYRCTGNVNDDIRVELGGTGCMAFNTDEFNISLDDFKHPNMADVFVAKLANEQNIPITVLKHKSIYLQYIRNKRTIWLTNRIVDKQTQILQSFLV